MPKYLKWSTTNVDDANQYGNIWVANNQGNQEYGPTPSTGFYVGIDPPEGGYTLYIYNNSVNHPYIYQASNDTNLVSLYNTLFKTNLTTPEAVKNAIDSNNNLLLEGQIERDSLVFSFDAANTDSYLGTGTAWTDLQGNNNATLQSGPSYSNGVISFDGVNDYMEFASNNTVSVPNFTFWVLWELPTQTSGAWNYFLYHDPAGNHKYEFGQFGTGADTFHFKDNISYAGTAVFASMASTGYSSFAFGATSNGRTFTSVNGANKTIKDPGSNSTWGTTPTANLVFDELFRGAGQELSANVKKIALYSKELSNDEIAYNHNFAASYRL